MKTTLLYIVLIVLALVFLLPVLLSLGGIDVLPGGGGGGLRAGRASGAMIRSENEGGDWIPPIFSGDRVPSAIFDVAFHPENPDIVLAGTKGSGIWKSADGGTHWEAAPDRAGVLRTDADVYKIAISSASSSIIYVAAYQDKKGRVMKSEDRGEHFREVYFVSAERYGVFDVYADPRNADSVLAATGQGLLIRSRDGARTWRTVYNFSEPIFLLAVNPLFSDEMYVVTERSRLLKTFDGGNTWNDLSDSRGDGGLEGGGWEKTGYVWQGRPTFRRLIEIRNFAPQEAASFAINPHNPAELWRGTRMGLLRSQNGGFSWEQKDALLEQKDFPPRGIAFQAENPDKVFIAAGQKFSRSSNRGVSWNIHIIPASSPAKKLFSHPKKPGVLFMLLGR